MRVAAYERHAGQREAALGAYHVNNAVFGVEHSEVVEAELDRVSGQSVDLRLRNGVGYRLVLVVRRGVVVWHAENLLGPQTLDAALAKSVKCLRTCYFVAIQSVDVQLRRAAVDERNDVAVPYFIK